MPKQWNLVSVRREEEVPNPGRKPVQEERIELTYDEGDEARAERDYRRIVEFIEGMKKGPKGSE